MKNILYLLLTLTVVWGCFSSCNDKGFLDETVTTDLNYNRVFSDSALTEGFLAEIYRDVGFDVKGNRFSTISEQLGGLQTACDEAEFRLSSEGIADVQFASGTVNPIIITDDAWKIPYQNIRRVNIFFKGIEQAPLQSFRKARLKAEARFLRAWYYHIMVRHYGGVPLIGDTIYADGDKPKDTRDTFEDCVNYIVKECETAATEPNLPVKPTGSYYGHAGRGACRALIARIKLLAASPLYNGNSDIVAGTNVPAELVGYPGYSKKRWEEAMNAANDVISLGQYSLYVLHTDPFNNNNPDSGHGFYALFQSLKDEYKPSSLAESILDDRSLGRVARESWFQPPSRGAAKSGFIYQNLVDAFPMKNGKPISDPASGYDPNNPYANRDPRFNNTVAHDQTMIALAPNNNPDPINVYRKADGSSSGKDAVHQGTPTGYYINKMVSRHLAANAVHGENEATPILRFAEIYMAYAEAMNEYEIGDGNGSQLVSPADKTYEILKAIRARGGIEAGTDGMYGLKPDMTRLEMRQAIRDERRIEFAIEGHRFFDVRRWKIAEQTDSQMMTGMEVRLTPEGGKSYTRFNVRQRIFRKAMYFWPIPYAETSKSPNLIQNPNY
ncbi:RagB/SusD family nutrient uptake outer membrane protein [Dysgonomonas termitidis]|uniref:RagB/SusD family nutrient uptake outer membrane protein n=1 Tax=Dysgonomonas termitidis TaxID=1516126 RepID=A0ABV9L482_9BACT